MRSLFRGHIRYSPDEFKKLWSEAVFSFDTNVLLNAYRLNKTAADAFLNALKKLKGRVWLTYQVAEEFFRHYHKEVQDQLSTYDSVEKHLTGLAATFRNKFPRHPYLPIDGYARKLETLVKEVVADVARVKGDHKDPTYNDPTLSTFLDIVSSNIRNKPTDEELKTWKEEGAKRFATTTPPGFADRTKPEERKYGDTILWFQLLEHAKKEKKSIVFVTDDVKEDWYLTISGKTLGPLPALIQEMHDKADGALFYAYPMHRFVEEAATQLNLPTSAGVITEIEKVTQENRGLELEFSKLMFVPSLDNTTFENAHGPERTRPKPGAARLKPSMRRAIAYLDSEDLMNDIAESRRVLNTLLNNIEVASVNPDLFNRDALSKTKIELDHLGLDEVFAEIHKLDRLSHVLRQDQIPKLDYAKREYQKLARQYKLCQARLEMLLKNNYS